MMKWWSRLWRAVMGQDLQPLVSLPAPAAATPLMPAMKVDNMTLARAASRPAGPARAAAFLDLFPIPEPPHGIPEDTRAAIKVATDEAIGELYGFASLSQFGEGIGFMGFPYLAELTQRPEYRMISEIRAKEMTRKWIELQYTGDDEDKSDTLNQINEWLNEHRIQDLFRQAAEHDGFFGRSHIYIDTGASDKPQELRTPLILKPAKIPKGSKVSFRTVEALWTYPGQYNTSNPLNHDYFRPRNWYVQANIVDKSRFLTLISREVPDLLKAAYAFGGLSLSQMAKPYVDNWLRTRQSVSDLVHAFSIVVLMTNMGASLESGGADFFKRMDLFNIMRDNRGLFVVDKETEDLKNLAVPLGTLDALQAQSQEQLASVSQTPLVKLLGITPSGLNASSDGEIRVFYDNIHALQEHLFRTPLKVIIEIAQLVLFGAIDPQVTFAFVPLWQLDEAAASAVRKSDMDSDVEAINAGVLHPEESRKRLAAAKDSPYAGLDVDDVPEPPADEDADLLPDPAKGAEPRSVERSGV